MVKKIDITKFGIFNSYKWNTNIGGDCHFNNLNIIYGRNYSGKTTLSRIFRCIEKMELHKHHSDGDFTIECHESDTITHSNISTIQKDNQVRVYNTDFVSENLSWIHNEDGLILPFTILGAKNIEIDNEIKKITKELGNNGTDGLLFDLTKSQDKYKSGSKKSNTLKNDLEAKLKSKANDKIKLDKNLFLATSGKKTYNIRDIEAEIESIKANFSSYLLDPDDKEEKKRFLLEEPRPTINLFPEQRPNFDKYYQETKNILSREIKPNEQITMLINDNLLQEWVRHGIDNHKGKHEKCAFCGGKLPSDIWTKLDAHFNKESEELRADIEYLITTIKKAIERINDFIFINKENYYSNLHNTISPLIINWEQAKTKYSESLHSLINQLDIRRQNIFESHQLKAIEDFSEEILSLIVEINKVAKENNTRASTLTNDQHHTRYELRISEVAQFSIDIDFVRKNNELISLEKTNQALYGEILDKRAKVKQLVDRKESLESQAKDETKGAQLVNQHISDFFGHGELKLVAEGESPNIKFKITRDDRDAKNLSEGECSLISFCYFIAKLEDEIKGQEETRNLVVYIDDPISSLDSNHIFFMFSLIEKIIAKPNRYKQLFISTHNLDFLKYLKRLTSPNGKGSVSHYLIERRQKGNEKGSFLVPMPVHLKDYVTEFNYLFNEIYKVYKEVGGNKKAMISNTYNQFYNLPNNMRKFLECYLFYRFPNSESPLDNLSKIFNGNTPIIINRFINEYSHLTYIDRGWKPIDVDEAEECAKIVIEKIQEQDPEQFAALLESVR